MIRNAIEKERIKDIVPIFYTMQILITNRKKIWQKVLKKKCSGRVGKGMAFLQNLITKGVQNTLSTFF